MRRLRIDIKDLAMAMARSGSMMETQEFLDLETGQLVMIPPELVNADELSEEEIEDLPEWERELLPLALAVVEDTKRYEPIPEWDSREGYQLMVDFLKTVKDERLQERLAMAIRSKGAFRRFKDVLLGYPDERERWFEFEKKAQEEAAREWLERLEIEPITAEE